MFSWSTFFIVLGIVVALCIPVLLFVVLVSYLKEDYFPTKYYNAKRRMTDIEEKLSSDLTIGEKQSILSKDPEYVMARHEKCKYESQWDFFSKYFDGDLTRYSWFYNFFLIFETEIFFAIANEEIKILSGEYFLIFLESTFIKNG